MKRFFFLYSALSLLSCLFMPTEASAKPESGGNIIVESMIDSVKMVVGEQTGLHVSAIIKPGQQVRFANYQPQQMLTPGVEIVDMPRIDTVDAYDGFIKVTQHLNITAFEDSLYYIPPMKINIDGKIKETKSLALKVLTIDVDTLHPNQYFGPKDVQDNPFKWKEWEKLLLFSFLAMVFYVLCALAYLRLKSNKPIQLKVRIRKIIPPHQRALNAIEEIKTAGVPADEKAYYTQLTDTLRKYMEERFGFSAMEMTTAEIIARLKEEGDQEKLQELTMLFETADLVKFAKYTVGINENDRNLVSAIDFINTTKQDNLPTEERIVPTVTEQEKQTIRMRISLKWAIAVLVCAASALVAYVLWMLWDLTSA